MRDVSFIFHVMRRLVSRYHATSTGYVTVRNLHVGTAKTRFMFTSPERKKVDYYWSRTQNVGSHSFDTSTDPITLPGDTVGNNAVSTKTLSPFGYPGTVAVLYAFMGHRLNFEEEMVERTIVSAARCDAYIFRVVRCLCGENA